MSVVHSPADGEFWDPAWFFPTYYKVQPRAGGRPVPFDLWDSQRLLASYVIRCYQERKWLVHVKPRKEGSSTFFTGVVTQHVLFREGVQALIVAQRDDVAKQLARSANRFYSNLPVSLRPRRMPGVKRTIECPDIDSVLSVASVGQDDPARGFTGLHALLATEICKWGKVERSKGTVVRTVSDEENQGFEAEGAAAWTALLSNIPEECGFVVAESTPLHNGDELHKVWESAGPDSPWIKCFIPWTMIRHYAADPPPGWKLHSTLAKYAHTHQLNERQAFWMQSVGLPKCGQSLARFRSEYPISDVDCWELRGEKVFNHERIMEILRWLDKNTSFTEQTGEYQQWKEPNERHRYAIFCDPAGSWAKRDMFAIEVIDLDECAQVAEFHGYMDAWSAARYLAQLGEKWNRAIVYVEQNGVGEAVLNPLIRIYPRVYHRNVTEGGAQPGWHSNKRTKVEAVATAQELLRDRSCTIRSHRLLRQMAAYRGQWDKLNRDRDAQGGHYDLVAAWCGACWAYDHETGGRRARESTENPEERITKAWNGLVDRLKGKGNEGGFDSPWGRHT